MSHLTLNSLNADDEDYLRTFNGFQLGSSLIVVKHRFYHGYDNYMQHAFPHDDLKPISMTYADSLGKKNLHLCGQSAYYYKTSN